MNSANIRDQGLDIQNFKQNSCFDIDAVSKVAAKTWSTTGHFMSSSYPLPVKIFDPFDFDENSYLLRLSAPVSLKSNGSNADTNKEFYVKMWLSAKHPKQPSVPVYVDGSMRTIGVKGRQNYQYAAREFYTVTLDMGKTFGSPSLRKSESTSPGPIRFYFNFETVKNEFGFAFKFWMDEATASITKYKR